MKTKLQRLILNNLNSNKNEIENTVWKWFLNKNLAIISNITYLKNPDIFNVRVALKNSIFKRIRYQIKGNSSKRTSMSQRKFRRICLVTGRTRGVFRFTNLSRIQIKRAAKLRLISGLRLSSW